jgi:hypothetical protein
MNEEQPEKPAEENEKSLRFDSAALKIMTKAEQINFLIMKKGFLKVKVNSHISVPNVVRTSKEP